MQVTGGRHVFVQPICRGGIEEGKGRGGGGKELGRGSRRAECAQSQQRVGKHWTYFLFVLRCPYFTLLCLCRKDLRGPDVGMPVTTSSLPRPKDQREGGCGGCIGYWTDVQQQHHPYYC